MSSTGAFDESFADHGKAGDEIIQRDASLAFGRRQQRHALETGDVTGLRGDLAVGRHHHAPGLGSIGNGVDQVLRQAAIVEAGEPVSYTHLRAHETDSYL